MNYTKALEGIYFSAPSHKVNSGKFSSIVSSEFVFIYNSL